MLLLLRSIRRKLMTENKFTVYFLYAIGEIILVVVGILIAVQIDEWREDKVNRKKEVQILKNINQEFKRNKEQLEGITSQNIQMLKSTDWMLKFWPNYRKLNLDTLRKVIAAMSGTPTFNPSQSVTRSLINTASFELIQNDSLRMELLRFPDLYDDYHDEELDSKNAFHSELIPYTIKNIDMMSLNPANPSTDIDLSGLETMEYRNILMSRRIGLSFIVEKEELPFLQQCIDNIIRLSEME